MKRAEMKPNERRSSARLSKTKKFAKTTAKHCAVVPSMNEVLVNWLQSPGNYKRWQQGRVLPEIQALLQKNNYFYHDQTVRKRIKKIKGKYEAASNMLANLGIHDTEFELGKVNRNVMTKVMSCCPFFLQLKPAFHDMNEEEVQSPHAGSDITLDTEDAGIESKNKHLARPAKKRKQANDDDRLETTPSRNSWHDFSGSESASKRTSMSRACSAEKLASIPGGYLLRHECEIVQETHVPFSPNTRHQLEELAVEHKKQINQLRVKSEKERLQTVVGLDADTQEISVKAYRLRERHRLQEEGVPLDEINELLPVTR